MTIGEYVRCAIDDYYHGEKLHSSLLHACIAVDGTASKIFPTITSNRQRYVACIRQYYWIVQAMGLPGVDLINTQWKNVQLQKINNPDLAEIIYEIFRCNHAHGSEHPIDFELIKCVGTNQIKASFGWDTLKLPDTIIFALLGIAVFAKVNHDQTTNPDYFLTLEQEKFPINVWWGREDDFRPITEKYKKPEVTIKWDAPRP